MKRKSVNLIKKYGKWVIAIVGIYIVAQFITIRDQVMVVSQAPGLVVEQAGIVEARDAQGNVHNPEEDDNTFLVQINATGEKRNICRDDIVNAPDRASVNVLHDGKTVPAVLRGMVIDGDLQKDPTVRKLLITDPATSNGKWITPDQVVGGFQLTAPRPIIQRGLASLARQANPWLMVMAVLIFPTCFVLTTVRWHLLLKGVDIHLPIRRTFVLNMVGSFYNSFMPGAVGGDAFKMYYAAKQTPHKTRAVVSVLVDRVLGLIALVLIGGSMASYQYLASDNPNSPTAQACRHVALGCGLIILAFVVGCVVVLSNRVRRATGLEFVLGKLPSQKIRKIVQDSQHVGQMYRRRPMLIATVLLITAPVHLTVIFSAMLAGHAFGLPLSELFYFVAVPVIKLVSAIPISPQGAGVMETFALLLTSKQGATASQALALAMSIRVVELFWSLFGGVFVVRGGFSSPPQDEVDKLEGEDPEVQSAPRAAHTPARGLSNAVAVSGA